MSPTELAGRNGAGVAGGVPPDAAERLCPAPADRPFLHSYSPPFAGKLRQMFQDLDRAIAAHCAAASDAERAAAARAASALEARRQKFLTVYSLQNHLEPALWARLAAGIDDLAGDCDLTVPRTLPAFVMSVDIRRSTYLMLMAKSPAAFAHFIISLCSRLRDAVWDHHGFFEKFTGDGILACFPDTYSGPEHGRLAVQAAARCHEVFRDTYQEHYDSFKQVLDHAGVGIGLDYGQIYLGPALAGLTIIGDPVVYACRLSSAEAGRTLLSRPAFRELQDQLARLPSFTYGEPADEHDPDPARGAPRVLRHTRVCFQVKNEPDLLAYEVQLPAFAPSERPDGPSWVSLFPAPCDARPGPAPAGHS